MPQVQPTSTPNTPPLQGQSQTTPPQNGQTAVQPTDLQQTPPASEFDAGQALFGLMSDPDVQRVLEARRDGRQVQVVFDGEDSREVGSEATSEPSITDPTTKAIIDAVERRLKPLTDQVSTLQSLADTMTQRETVYQIKSVADRHPDFETYRKDMVALSKNVQGLNVEELYALAKIRRGDIKLTPPDTFTERPGPTPRPVREPHEKHPEAKPGRKGWDSSLTRALETLQL